MNMAIIPLYRIAHGRTGDKGDRSNISVIAYKPEHFKLIVEQVTEGRRLVQGRDDDGQAYGGHVTAGRAIE